LYVFIKSAVINFGEIVVILNVHKITVDICADLGMKNCRKMTEGRDESGNGMEAWGAGGF
jgi:hypothetical protein